MGVKELLEGWHRRRYTEGARLWALAAENGHDTTGYDSVEVK